jgi:hypothetical protein
MATLAESFLADLEDLSDDEPVAADAAGGGEGEADAMEEDKVGAGSGPAPGLEGPWLFCSGLAAEPVARCPV